VSEAIYGARFLAVVNRLRCRSSMTSGFNYAAIEGFNDADRDEFVGILRRQMTLPYAILQRIQCDEPESIARWYVETREREARHVGAIFTVFSVALIAMGSVVRLVEK
jgi:hypothetical protein